MERHGEIYIRYYMYVCLYAYTASSLRLGFLTDSVVESILGITGETIKAYRITQSVD